MFNTSKRKKQPHVVRNLEGRKWRCKGSMTSAVSRSPKHHMQSKSSQTTDNYTQIRPLQPHISHHIVAKLKPTTQLILLFGGIICAFTMTSIFQRLTRPFTSSSMRFTPEQAAQLSTIPEGAQKATLAAGCFWGIEHMYRKDFGGKGLLDARVGYIGGNTKNPSYRAVCSGSTGHAEACQIVFDPQQLSYRTILEYFYKMHDPTTMNRQGMDTGSQYRSGIFYHDEEQKSVAEDVTKKANEQWWKNGIVTEILPAGEWWDAEKYHQLYLDNNPGGYECASHYVRKFPDLQ